MSAKQAEATGTWDEEYRRFYALAHSRSPLEIKVDELEQRVEALEQQQAATRKPLAAQAEHRRQASLDLRTQIESLMAAHSGPGRLTAKRIAKLLDRDPPPSIRTIQDHMRAINAATSVPRC